MKNLIIFDEIIINSEHIISIQLNRDKQNIDVLYKVYTDVQDSTDVESYTFYCANIEEAMNEFNRLKKEIKEAKFKEIL